MKVGIATEIRVLRRLELEKGKQEVTQGVGDERPRTMRKPFIQLRLSGAMR